MKFISAALSSAILAVSSSSITVVNAQAVTLAEASAPKGYFNRVATFPVCTQIDPTCNDDTETVAEIVRVTDDGMTAVYTDSEYGAIGMVDITDPANPTPLGTFDVGGEPTSVALKDGYALVCINTSPDFVNPSGTLKVFDIADPSNPTLVREIELGGQPDSIEVSPDKQYAAVAIENERDEDLGDGELPQLPAGYVVVMDIGDDDPANWSDPTNIELTGLDGLYEPTDPEPEFIHINEDNIAVVSLQENNAVVLIDVAAKTVIASYATGIVDLTNIDTLDDSMVKQDENLEAVVREPDGVTWIGTEYFATANEGDMLGGTRGFTIFSADGGVVWESGSSLEHIVTSMGHYPDGRSDNKGIEIENVAYAPDLQMLFVVSERANVIAVYDVSDPINPVFHQMLPSGVSPEGSAYVQSRGLFVAACEKDSRDDKMRASLGIYQYDADATKPQYPTMMSVENKAIGNGVPIAWGAISGLSASASDTSTLYALDDSAFNMNRIFVIDTSTGIPAMIVDHMYIKDTNGVFAAFPTYGEFDAADLAAMINEDGTVNIDGEGIAADPAGGFWIASEGSGTIGDESRPIEKLNFLFKLDDNAVIEKVVSLPDEVNDIQLRFGFEGVTIEGDYVIVAFQRAWGEEDHPRLGLYNTADESWKFVFYPLDEVESQNGGWVGLSDITYVGDGNFLVLERDNQGGPFDAAIKRIYIISLGDLSAVEDGSSVTKTLVKDVLDDMKSIGGAGYEKLEGMAYLDGDVWISNDNDAVSDNSGETQLVNLGAIYTPQVTEPAPSEQAPTTPTPNPPTLTAPEATTSPTASGTASVVLSSLVAMLSYLFIFAI